MKRIVLGLLVLIAAVLSAGQVKLKTGQVYEGDVKQVGKVVTIIKDGAVFQFQMKDVAEMDGKAVEQEKNPVIKIMTSKGDIIAELFEDDAPNTVANIISLAEQGYFQGMAFHRVIKGFMAQARIRRRARLDALAQAVLAILSTMKSPPNSSICAAPSQWLMLARTPTAASSSSASSRSLSLMASTPSSAK